MRYLLGLIGIVALVLIVLLSFGFLTLNATPGSLPTVKVEGGSAPKVDANVARVNFGSENKTVEIPTVTVSKPATPTQANTARPQ